jgi:hypothetical protein
MSGLAVWLYMISGEVVALLALFDHDVVVLIRSVGKSVRWWIAFAGAVIFVGTWPIASLLLLLLPKRRPEADGGDR